MLVSFHSKTFRTASKKFASLLIKGSSETFVNDGMVFKAIVATSTVGIISAYVSTSIFSLSLPILPFVSSIGFPSSSSKNEGPSST